MHDRVAGVSQSFTVTAPIPSEHIDVPQVTTRKGALGSKFSLEVLSFAVSLIVLFAALSLSVQFTMPHSRMKRNRKGSEQQQHPQQEAAAQTAPILGDVITNDPGEIYAVALVAATGDPDEAAAIGAIIAAGILRNEPAALPPAAPCPAAPIHSATTRHMYKTQAANDRR